MTATNAPIAVVGLAVQLPDGKQGTNLDVEGFASLMHARQSSISPFPQDRFRHDGLHGKEQGSIVPVGGGFLSNADALDNFSFGLSKAEFQKMTPAAIRMTDVCHQALLDSGLAYRSTDMGCYVGAANPVASFDSYDDVVYSADEHYESGAASCMLANRISYLFDLHGPSFPIETACSSSATAIHVACQAIRQGECQSAIVGTTNTIADVESWVGFSRLGVLSPEAVSHVFDDRANGYVRAEAAGAIVLKDYQAALRDGDHIYSTIIGSAVNSNGNRSLSLVAPSASAQQECFNIALAQANKTPHDLDFWEMHGTGTRVGDSTELNGYGDTIFGKHARSKRLPIGSVKSNVGHTELSAGLVSIVKLCIMLRDRVLLPNINFQKPSSVVHWERFNFCVLTQPEPLKTSKPAVMGLASSGFGGANACIIVEEHREAKTSNPLSNGLSSLEADWQLLCVGGLTPRLVTQVCDLWRQQPKSTNIDSVAMAREMRSSPFRSYGLAKLSAQSEPISFTPARAMPRTKPFCTFVFSGQGSQHFHMARSWYQAVPLFRQAIEQGCSIVHQLTGMSLIADAGLFLESGWTAEQESQLSNKTDAWPIDIALLATCILQMAIFDVLVSWNIDPDLLVGHSAGETSVYYASGACSRQMTLEIAVARSRAFKTIEGLGTMAYVHGPAALAEKLVRQDRDITIGAYNSHSAFLLSGPQHTIEVAIEEVKREGATAGLLKTRTPIHSNTVELCRKQYFDAVEAIFASHGAPVLFKRAFVSTVTAMRYEAGHQLTATDVYANARKPVLFTQAINVATSHARARGKQAVFVEIGAHPVLSGYIADNAAFRADSDVCISLLKRGSPASSVASCKDADNSQLLHGVANLLIYGFNNIPLDKVLGRKDAHTSKRLRAVPETKTRQAVAGPSATLFRSPPCGPLSAPRQRISQQSHPDLAEHIIDGSVIMPATGFCEIGFELGAHELRDVEFLAPLNIPAQTAMTLAIEKRGYHFSIRMSTELAKGGGMNGATARGDVNFNRILCRGLLVEETDAHLSRKSPPRQCMETLGAGLDAEMSHEDIYQLQTNSSSYGRWFGFGPKFRRVEHVSYSLANGLAVGRVRGNVGDLTDSHRYRLHPAYLDAAGQVSCPLLFAHCSELNGTMLSYFLPSFAERVQYFDCAIPEIFYASARLVKARQDDLVFDVVGFTSSGDVLFQIDGFSLHRIINTSPPKVENLLERWQPYWSMPPLPLKMPSDMATRDTFVRLVESLLLSGKKCIRVLVYGTDLTNTMSLLDAAWADASGVQPETTYVEWLVAEQAPNLQSTPLSQVFKSKNSGFNDLTLDASSTEASLDVVVWQDATKSLDSSASKFFKAALLPGGTLFCVSRANSVSELLSEANLEKQSHALRDAGWDIFCCARSEELLETRLLACTPYLLPLKFVQALPSALSLPHVIFHHQNGNEHELAARLHALAEDVASSPNILLFGSDRHTTIALGRSIRQDLPDATVLTFVYSQGTSTRFQDEFSNEVAQHSLKAWYDCEVAVTADIGLLVPRLVQREKPRQKSTHLPDNTSMEHVDVVDGKAGRLLASVSLEVAGYDDDTLPESILIIGDTKTARAVASNMASRCVCAVDESCKLLAKMSNVDLVLRGSGWGWNYRHKHFDLVVAFIDSPDLYTGHATTRVLFQSKRDALDLTHTVYRSSFHTTVTLNVEDMFGQSKPESAVFRKVFRKLRLSQEQVALLRQQTSLPGPFGLRHTRENRLQERETDPVCFRDDVWYLIVGGVGGLGVRFSNYLFRHGARHICLTARSGGANLRKDEWQQERAIIEGLKDDNPSLELLIEAVDATDASAMASLIERLNTTKRIAGLAYLPVTLTDGAFPTRTQADFEIPRRSKIVGLQITLAAIASSQGELHQDGLPRLDFVLAASSLATVAGSPGQATYTVANAELESFMNNVPNGAAIVVIPLLDGGVYRRTLDSLPSAGAASQMGQRWGVTVEHYLLYLEEALRYIQQDVRLGRYLPLVNMASVARSAPYLRFGHLLRLEDGIGGADRTQGADGVHPTDAVVAEVLDIDTSNLEPELALTHFGLDSISSIRLTNRLRTKLNLSVPQVQLLFAMTLQLLRDKYEETMAESVHMVRANKGKEEAAGEALGGRLVDHASDTTTHHEEGPNVKGEEDQACHAVPLNANIQGPTVYALPGAGGGATAFEALASRLSCPLVLITESPARPPASLDALVSSMLRVIIGSKHKRDGEALPSSSEAVRLCGFSFGASLALLLAQALEQQGQICDLVFIDHVPIASQNFIWLSHLGSGPSQRAKAIRMAVTQGMRRESTEQGGSITPDVYHDLTSSNPGPIGRVWQEALGRHVDMLDQILSEQVVEVDGTRKSKASPPPQVASPITIIRASNGFLADEQEKQEQGGIHEHTFSALSATGITNIVIPDTGHFSVMRSQNFFDFMIKWTSSELTATNVVASA